MARTQLNEIFECVDEEYGDITARYITNDARGCKEVAGVIDAISFHKDEDQDELKELSNEFPELVEELGKICFNKLVVLVCGNEDIYGDWFEGFYYLCKKRGIKLIEPNNEEQYEY